MIMWFEGGKWLPKCPDEERRGEGEEERLKRKKKRRREEIHKPQEKQRKVGRTD